MIEDILNLTFFNTSDISIHDLNTSVTGTVRTVQNNDTLPPNLIFNENSLNVIIAYCVMFMLAAVGNLSVFITLLKSRHRKSRISLMIIHLAIADLLVTFVMIPLEIIWRVTVQWIAGEIACKLLLFLRAFGLYLSSNVLICISLDRYYAVLHPLRVSVARKRGKSMLTAAWCVSLLYSFPQSVVFHVQSHPEYPAFRQCVTFGFFKSPSHEVAYNMFCLIAMYFVPLVVICFAYTAILCEIQRNSRENKIDNNNKKGKENRLQLRRSDTTNIERARIRTLRMTANIVVVFVFCWTPYAVITLWYMIDRESAMQIDTRVQDALFLMAVSNSCMNPLVYGSYAMNCRNMCCCCRSTIKKPQMVANSKVRNNNTVRNLHSEVTTTPKDNNIVSEVPPAHENLSNTITVIPEVIAEQT